MALSTDFGSRSQPVPSGWLRVDQQLVREISFRDFDEALAFVEQVATEVEDHLRRPDLCIHEFNRVRIMIANPKHAGVTAAELRLLTKVQALLER